MFPHAVLDKLPMSEVAMSPYSSFHPEISAVTIPRQAPMENKANDVDAVVTGSIAATVPSVDTATVDTAKTQVRVKKEPPTTEESLVENTKR